MATRQDAITTIATGSVSDTLLSPDGQTLYVARAGTIFSYDVTSGNLQHQWTLGTKLNGIDVSPDGQYIVATELAPGETTGSDPFQTATSWSVYRLDLAAGSVRTYTNQVVGFNGSNYHDVVALPNGNAILTQNFPGSGFTPLTTLDLANGKFSASSSSYGQNGTLNSTADHTTVVFAPSNISDAPVALYKVGQGIVAERGGYRDNVSGFNSGVQAISSDGKLIVEGVGLNVYDQGLHLVTSLSSKYQINAVGMAFDRSGERLYILDAKSSSVLQLDTTNFDVIAGYKVGAVESFKGGFGNILQVSSDGTDLVVTGQQSIQIVDLNRAVSYQGTAGDDLLAGTVGDDLLFAGAGNDRILVTTGSDQLSGGAGADAFVFSNPDTPNYTYVTISDFSMLQGDKLEFRGVSGINTVEDVLSRMSDYGLSSDISLNAGRVQLSKTPGQALDASNIIVRGVAPSDYTGDGHSDILFRNADGSLSAWTVAGERYGNLVQQGVYNAAADTSWKIVETSDFNGDGRADILWRQDSGAVAIWGSTGTQFSSSTYYRSAPVPVEWRIAATGDVNADGKGDILWQKADGQLSLWTAELGTYDGSVNFREASYSHSSVGPNWKVAGLGDFNGDNRADILWRNTDGSVAAWTNDGTGKNFNEGSFFQPNVPTSWHIDGIGDLNGDGRDDLIWRNANGAVSTWRSNGTGFDQSVWNGNVDNSWKIAQIADYNGDGKADLLWRNDSGAVSTWQSNGSGFDQSVYNSAVDLSWNIAGFDFIL